jgi:hypothetical protein
VQDVQNLNEYFDQFLLEHPYPKEVVYEEEIAANNEEPQQRRRKRRATMFHSLVSLLISLKKVKKNVGFRLENLIGLF